MIGKAAEVTLRDWERAFLEVQDAEVTFRPLWDCPYLRLCKVFKLCCEIRMPMITKTQPNTIMPEKTLKGGIIFGSYGWDGVGFQDHGLSWQKDCHQNSGKEVSCHILGVLRDQFGPTFSNLDSITCLLS